MVARPRDYDSGGRLVVDGSWWQAWRCGRMSRFLRDLWEELGAAPGAVDMWASDGAPQQACGILGIRGEIGWGEDDPFGFGSKVVEAAADMVHVGNREESASTSQEKSASTSFKARGGETSAKTSASTSQAAGLPKRAWQCHICFAEGTSGQYAKHMKRKHGIKPGRVGRPRKDTPPSKPAATLLATDKIVAIRSRLAEKGK